MTQLAERTGSEADRSVATEAVPQERESKFALMPETFPRSVRQLEGDALLSSWFTLAGAGVLLAAWLAWFFLAEVGVHVASSSARIEVDQAAHRIEARANGRVTAVHVRLNDVVTKGQVMAELESSRDLLRLNEEQARQKSLQDQIRALRAEIVARHEIRQRTESATLVALDEARAQQREAASPARFATFEAERLARLHQEGLIAEVELRRREAEAEQRQTAASARQIEVERLEAERAVTLAAINASLAELDREMEELRGQLAISQTVSARLSHVVDEYLVRAPADGSIGGVAEVRPGDVVTAGTSFGSVVPRGSLQAVAFFPTAEVIGRLRVGQSASLRLDGFPWTQYGSIDLQVAAVGREAVAGNIRVEFTVNPSPSFPIQLQHGLTGQVDVDIEHVSPAILVLRTATGLLRTRQPSKVSRVPDIGP